MKTLWFTGLLMAGTAGSIFAGDEIIVERVIGSEAPGEYKHPCTITELNDGDLYIACYGGTGEYEDDSKVWGMRKAKGATSWSAPVCIADTPFLGEGNPVVWQAPDGRVWLFYVQRYGDTWSDSRINAKISKDGAVTWSDSFMIIFQQGMMSQGLPMVLNDGAYLLPAYHETGHDQEKTDPDTASLFFRINARTNTWTETGKIHVVCTSDVRKTILHFTFDEEAILTHPADRNTG